MIRSRCFTFLGIGAALVFVVGSAMAQKAPPGRGPQNVQPTRLTLTYNPQVQAELKITEEQKTKIDDMRASLRPPGVNTEGMSPQEKKAVVEKRKEDIKKAGAIAEKKLKDILTPDQMKKLDEVFVSVRGASALQDEKVADELKLTAEQKKKIADLLKAEQEELAKLPPGREDIMKLKEIRKASETKVLAVLNPDQKTQFEKMKGASPRSR